MEIILSRHFAENRAKYLDDAHFHALLRVFSVNPEYGMPMPRSDGLRRARWDFSLQPDSEGVKVFYYWNARDAQLFLLTLFAKELQDNLTNQQCDVLAKKVKEVFPNG